MYQKKILIVGVSNRTPNLEESGGVSRNVNNLINSSSFTRKFKYEIFDDHIRLDNFLPFFVNALKLFYSLHVKLNNKKYNLVLLHCNSINFDFIKKFLILLILKLSDTKVVVRYGGSQSSMFFSKSQLEFLFQPFFKMQSGIIVQEETGESFYKRFKKNNIFSRANFVLSSQSSTITNNKFNEQVLNIILVAGEDFERKGFPVSLDAINILDSKNNFRIYAVGCDSQSINQIRDRRLENYITILPKLKYQTLEKLMSKSHILLLPSYNEGLPNIILEAMSKGLTIISTPVGSIPDILSSGENGYLVEKGNYKQIAKHIEDLRINPDILIKFSQNNSSKINDFYSEKAVLPKLIQFLDNI